MILLFISVALILLLVHFLVKKCWHCADVQFAGFPTLSRLPILGHFHYLIGGDNGPFQLVCKLTEIIEEKDLPFYMCIGPFPVLCTQDPEDLRTITNTFIGKAYFYDFARFWVGDGLITARTPIWKQRIKKLGGAFSTVVVDSYQDVFNMQAAKCLEKMKGEAGDDYFDALAKYIAPAALETLCQTALGVSGTDEEIDSLMSEYRLAFKRMFTLLTHRALNLFLHPEFVYRLTPWHREMMKYFAVLSKLSSLVLTNKYKERDEMKKTGSMGKESKLRSYMDILLDLKESDPTFTDKDVLDEVYTVIGAGHETNSSTILFCLVMLGEHPDVQDKLYEEIKSIFGDNKRPVSKKDLSQMPYCEAVICETLRLYPPIPLVLRSADSDLQIKSCTIPKGTICAVNIRGMGRSWRRWGDDAAMFRPERWLEPGFSPLLGSYIPFSYGKRACIGKKFAMELLKTFLVHILRDLEVESEAEKLQFKIDVVLKPIAGHHLKVRLRDK